MEEHQAHDNLPFREENDYGPGGHPISDIEIEETLVSSTGFQTDVYKSTLPTINEEAPLWESYKPTEPETSDSESSSSTNEERKSTTYVSLDGALQMTFIPKERLDCGCPEPAESMAARRGWWQWFSELMDTPGEEVLPPHVLAYYVHLFLRFGRRRRKSQRKKMAK